MRLLACAAVAMSVLAGAAHAGEWRFVAGNDEANFVFDEASVRGEDVKTFWIAMLYKETQHTEQSSFDLMLRRVEFDCNNQSTREMALVVRDANGQVIYSRETPRTTGFVIPESADDWVWKAVCLDTYILNVPIRYDSLSDALRFARAKLEN